MKMPFLDLGDGTAVYKNKVVLILDAESATVQKTTRDFLKKMSRDGTAVLPKKPLKQVNSLVLLNSYGKDSLYTSSRSPGALAKETQKNTLI